MAIPSNSLASSQVYASWTSPYEKIRLNRLVDYDRGGNDINDPFGGLYLKVWEGYYEPDDQTIYVVPYDGGTPHAVLTASNVEEISITFDQNMNPTVCYLNDTGMNLHWFDSSISQMVTTNFPNISSAFVRLDDKRQLSSETNDILFVYIENGFIKYRQQRDRYVTEYVLRETNATVLAQVGMNTKWRVQVLEAGEIPECVPLENGEVTVACICADMATRAGVPYNTGDLSANESLIGYRIDTQQSARSWIEPLMSTYQFDAYESDGKIIFRTRNNSPIATYNDGDLAATTSEGKNAEKTTISRTQESELPRVINLGYRDIDFDHEPGIQTATRTATSALSESTINVPIVMTKDQAKQKAEELLRRVWLNRENISFVIPSTEIGLKPTDKVILNVDGVPNVVRLTSLAYEISGVIKCEGIIESLEGLNEYSNYINWKSTSLGSSGGIVPQTTPEPIGPVIGHVLDIPLIKDYHEDGGVYLAANSIGSFRGAYVYISDDDGINWRYLTKLTKSVTGKHFYPTNTTPEDPATQNFYADHDYASLKEPMHDGVTDKQTIRITLDNPNDKLYSISHTEALQRNKNMALLNNEIICFETATYVSPGVYDITDLHRGLRGSDMSYYKLIDFNETSPSSDLWYVTEIVNGDTTVTEPGGGAWIYTIDEEAVIEKTGPTWGPGWKMEKANRGMTSLGGTFDRFKRANLEHRAEFVYYNSPTNPGTLDINYLRDTDHLYPVNADQYDYWINKGIFSTQDMADRMASGECHERFVMLDNVYRLPLSNDKIGNKLQFKFLAYGEVLESVQPISCRYQGVSWYPYSICHPYTSETATNIFTTSWIRRARKDGEWRDNVDVPLEESEQYFVSKWVPPDVDYQTNALQGTETVTSATSSIDVSIVNVFGVKTYGMQLIQPLSSVVGKGPIRWVPIWTRFPGNRDTRKH